MPAACGLREYKERFTIDPAAFDEPSEKRLFTAVKQAEAARAAGFRG
jgi:hypothetical protein